MLAPEVLVSPTPEKWIAVALDDFDSVLMDHAHCEKKAAASAMALVQNYPHDPELVRPLVKLAQEELRHFQQVHEIIIKRGLHMVWDKGDPYAQQLMKTVRRVDKETRLLDWLLVASLIEARSWERLYLLSQHLEDVDLAKFYRGLAVAEAGHHRLFVQLAELGQSKQVVSDRLVALAAMESEMMLAQPLAPRIH